MTKTYDMVVIGGGIHGAGVAQAGAAAGYKVLLLEKTGLAHATSSRSSKLIHGGLRYLESWQLDLVRESLKEREILLRIAPNLVQLKPFYIPVYRETTRRPWKIRAGLSLYSLLGNFSVNSRFHKLSKSEWALLDGLRMQGLRAVYRYWDGQTDDIKLTNAVMGSALSLGATLKCPASFISASYSNNQFEIHYQDAGGDKQCSARSLINAAGPWANTILSQIKPDTDYLNIDLVQGTHIILDQTPGDGIFYLESPKDQRAIFVMPWQGKTLVGTTETHYQGDPDNIQPLENEISYLLDTVGKYFPMYQRKIIGSFAGLRVLPVGEGPAFHRPRETTLHTDTKLPGLVTIYGGKLTGYRATAQKAVTLARTVLPAQKIRADTATLSLSSD
ncbi:MAG: glycerol-3-phosphate dehydrogenase/oxidase [Gammaproteobacteria bacterium]|nr:glycerol-3-phosphate dehydrogenase/oxidase [Gammaproteobacteria bacterium]